MKIDKIIALTVVIIGLTSCGKKTQETKPIRKDVTETVFASGILEANDTYNLTAETDGYLIQIQFNEGDLVNEGQVLAAINNKQNNFNTKSSSALYEIARQNTFSNAPSLAQAKNSSQLAKQKMELDSTLYFKYQILAESNSVSKSDYDNSRIQYQTSRASYLNAIENYNQVKQQAEQALITNEAQKDISNILSSNNEIIAVFNGKVYKKFKQKGDYVKKGDVIATIGDANFIYAKVNIDEGNIEKVKVGQEAVVKLNINNSKVYKGTVSEIYPSFNENTQSFTCKIIINEPLQFTIVNTQLQSNIIIAQTKNALLIPSNYIDFGGNVEVKDKKEKVKVTTKFVSNEWVQVLSGIDENTVLVTDNIKENNETTSEVGAQLNR
jgi:HlyD family secretion protein